MKQVTNNTFWLGWQRTGLFFRSPPTTSEVSPVNCGQSLHLCINKNVWKKSRFHKKYVIFWWASNQNWYEICEFVKICYYWVNNCEVPLSVWGLFASVQHFCQLQNLQPVIVYLKIVQFIIQTCKSMDFVRTYFFVSEPLSSLTLIFGI